MAIAVAWLGLSGFGGLFLLWMWTFSTHWSTYWNQNFLQFTPLALLLAIVLPFSARSRRWETAWFVVSAMAAALSLLGLLLKMVVAYQANLELLALAVPPHLAMAWLAYATRKGGPIAPTTQRERELQPKPLAPEKGRRKRRR
jgi:hypothetical protein